MVDLSANRIRVLDIPDPLFRLLLSLRRGRKHPDPDHFILASDSGGPICPANIRMSKLKPIGRRLGMPWLSWQVLKRTHDALLWELRIQLNRELAVCAR
jgi:hypothetical protein